MIAQVPPVVLCSVEIGTDSPNMSGSLTVTGNAQRQGFSFARFLFSFRKTCTTKEAALLLLSCSLADELSAPPSPPQRKKIPKQYFTVHASIQFLEVDLGYRSYHDTARQEATMQGLHAVGCKMACKFREFCCWVLFMTGSLLENRNWTGHISASRQHTVQIKGRE